MPPTSSDTGRHVCECGKSFLRKEHLRRHQATHSGPAFSCLVCGRSFSRSDLLRRHAAIHGTAAAVPDSRRGRACDTCHANKTRCDGGKQCTLCIKRGVRCTYGRRETNSPSSQPRAGSGSRSPADRDGRTSGSAPTSAPVSPPSTESDAVAPSNAAFGLAAPEILNNGVHHQGFTTRSALQAILSAAAAHCSVTVPAVPPSPLTVPESWLTSCTESYMSTFHNRWPIIHAPSFDQATDSVLLVASIVMINSWLHYDRSFKEMTMRIHDLLVEQSFKDLSNDTYDPRKPWPLDTYQVALLNIIFAFETGRESCIKRARRLLSLLVAALRQNDCFSSEAQERERNTHFPGPFVPWVFTTLERWKRLAVAALQIDVYLSLFCNEPPLLRREEFDLGLTSTFAMWNSYGLHIFFPRNDNEPWERNAYKMSSLDVGSHPHSPHGILIEDVQLCLLGTWSDIWLLQQQRRNRSAAVAAKMDLISRQLVVYKHQLDAIEDAMERPQLHGQYTDFLLRAYSGKGLPSEPKWRERVLERFYATLSRVRMLHRLLAMHLYADLPAVREIARMSPSMASEPDAAASTATPMWQRKALQIQEWAISPDSRAAVLQAMYVSRTYRETPVAQSPIQQQPRFADPVAYMALSAAAAVFWAWTVHTIDACTCTPELPFDIGAGRLAADPAPEVEEWVRHGTGSVALYGMPVCKCSAAGWLTHFAEALARGGERWEMGSMCANVCLSKLAFS
ncbi:transcription factor Zn, C2H2 / Cys6 [Purpureocillium lavendulum]|uniref:Transcription factor Zn, C2H2 / Cys6 n=1 Tax=Purpureocillium lavendulum TaxID=1247861 RepID=A0AB34FEU0_9HYPO|nr:transcription factor Zn, C2H2 / Cys6 [Purpureocillium lavendulum]